MTAEKAETFVSDVAERIIEWPATPRVARRGTSESRDIWMTGAAARKAGLETGAQVHHYFVDW